MNNVINIKTGKPDQAITDGREMVLIDNIASFAAAMTSHEATAFIAVAVTNEGVALDTWCCPSPRDLPKLLGAIDLSRHDFIKNYEDEIFN